jgi:hypothetical protein
LQQQHRSDFSARRLFWLFGCLTAGCLPALFGPTVAERVSGLYTLAANPQPYVQPDYAWLLYAVVPLVSVSSFLFYLAPGVLLVLTFSNLKSITEGLVLSFGVSLLLTISLGTTLKLANGGSLSAEGTMISWMGATVLSGAVLWVRSKRVGSTRWLEVTRTEARRAGWMTGAALLAVAALIPKLFWESFNIDGIEAYEFGRSLTTHMFPHWELENGVFGFYRNFVLFAYPNHWFFCLLGPFEVSARLPFILYLVVAFAALILLIERHSARLLSMKEEAALWLAVACFTVVQTYNTNYEPFYADLAENAATDTLAAVCFLAACNAIWSDRTRWFWVFGIMTFLASPGGLLLLIGLAVGILLAQGENWRAHLRLVGTVIALCIAASVLYEIFYIKWLLGGVNDQFSSKNMLRRLFPPTLTEFVRLNALLFPCGLLPALFIPLVRRKDTIAWSIGVVTVIYFGLLYLQAWTSLHQFTLVMLLPLICFWRVYLHLSEHARRWLLPSVYATTVLSLILSLPREFQINIALREFGQATDYQVGDYEKSYQEAISGAWSLKALLPEDYRMQYPNQPWGADPLAWIYYATREKPAGAISNYIVQKTSMPAPVDAVPVLNENGLAVYVRDLQVWERERNRQLPQVTQSLLYEPILRRTYAFFRDYVATIKLRESTGKPEMESQ